jgi:hypothetical protein
VLRNGVQLVVGVDVTATNGTTFVLTNAATAGDTLVAILYTSFIVANAVAKSGDTMTGNLNITGGTLQVGGNQAVNGPAFSAYRSTNQSVSNVTFTKVQCNIEEFDTNSNYDNTTNYRFTPTVAGYYQVNAEVKMVGSSQILIASIYKNGSEFKRGTQAGVSTGTMAAAVVSALIYLNGSTDYIEAYVYQDTGGALNIEGSSGTNGYFQASMVRGA